MKVAIGIDVGTTAARGVAVDDTGRVLAAATSPYPLLTPRPQWAEQEPAAWWHAARTVLAELARSLMEGVLFGLREALDTIRDLGVHPTRIRITGGGSGSDLWRQLQADTYGLPIERLAVDEGAAYGAALLGHITGRTFRDVTEATSLVRPLAEHVDPDPGATATYEDLYAVYRQLYPVTAAGMHRLSALARR